MLHQTVKKKRWELDPAAMSSQPIEHARPDGIAVLRKKIHAVFIACKDRRHKAFGGNFLHFGDAQGRPAITLGIDSKNGAANEICREGVFNRDAAVRPSR